MKVVGLHFGGWPMQEQFLQTDNGDMLAQLFYENGAVPLWILGDDSLLRDVTFT